MKGVKKVFSFLLSILIFIITLVSVSLLIFKTLIGSGFIENTVQYIIDGLKEEKFEVDDKDLNESSKFVVKQYDENGNYIGDYEIDLADINYDKILEEISNYLDQILDYIKEYDEQKGNTKIYLDSNKIINPITIEVEKIIDVVEKNENIELDDQNFKEEIKKSIDEFFVSLNNELNKVLSENNLLILYVKNYVINNNFLIMLIIIDILICGLIVLMYRQINSLFYIAIPMGLSSGLILFILGIVGLNKITFPLYLIGSIPLLIALGLVVLFYFVKRNNQ